jgi:hypothetical protein
MRKFYIIIMAVMMLSVSVFCISPVQAEDSKGDVVNKTVKLSDQQISELSTLNKDILEKKKQVISKYVEYGIMTEKKGKIMISRMEKYYTKLEQDGFIPNWDKPKRKHKD